MYHRSSGEKWRTKISETINFSSFFVLSSFDKLKESTFSRCSKKLALLLRRKDLKAPNRNSSRWRNTPNFYLLGERQRAFDLSISQGKDGKVFFQSLWKQYRVPQSGELRTDLIEQNLTEFTNDQ